MNILLLTQVVPYPADSGPKIKTHFLLRYLTSHHRVTLVTFTRNADEEAAAEHLRGMCAAVHTVALRRSRVQDALALARSLRSNRPLIIERDDSTAMRRLLRTLVADAAACGSPFDLVHADQLNMAQFAADLPLPRLLDQHNAVWTIFIRMALQERGIKRLVLEREWRLLRHYEGVLARSFEATTTVSHEDRRALQEAAQATLPMPVIPIAIDVEAQQVIPREADARAILSMATMMWPPNVDGVLWFTNEIYPRIKQQVGDTSFFVVGQRPVAEIRALAEQDASVTVTGYVPDTAPYIAASACMIVPLRSGGGMRVKILEALARGIPIVSTTIGCEGIDVTPGEHLLVADTPEDFAAAVVRLLNDRAFGEAMAAAGREHVRARYDWRAVCPAMDAAYASMGVSEHSYR